MQEEPAWSAAPGFRSLCQAPDLGSPSREVEAALSSGRGNHVYLLSLMPVELRSPCCPHSLCIC